MSWKRYKHLSKWNQNNFKYSTHAIFFFLFFVVDTLNYHWPIKAQPNKPPLSGLPGRPTRKAHVWSVTGWAFMMRWNRWRGSELISLIRSVGGGGAVRCTGCPVLQLWDHRMPVALIPQIERCPLTGVKMAPASDPAGRESEIEFWCQDSPRPMLIEFAPTNAIWCDWQKEETSDLLPTFHFWIRKYEFVAFKCFAVGKNGVMEDTRFNLAYFIAKISLKLKCV